MTSRLELFKRVLPKEGPYSWMVWDIDEMQEHWFQTRADAESYIASRQPAAALTTQEAEGAAR